MGRTSSDAILLEPPGLVPFAQAWQQQRQLQQRLLEDPEGPAAVLLLEHQPCYTLGRGADPAFLRFDPANPPHPLFRIDRGGEVTHHCPGQLVLYPVLNLQRHGAEADEAVRQARLSGRGNTESIGATRDAMDATRRKGALYPALDAVRIDNTQQTPDETYAILRQHVLSRFQPV
jgi:hypothetical protein